MAEAPSLAGLVELLCCSGANDHARRSLSQDPINDNSSCGVGINFKPDVSGALYVHSLVPGSPAALDGLITEGDRLEQVDGQYVYRCSLKQVSTVLLGREGTLVRLTMQRPTGGGTERIETVLRRANIKRLRAFHDSYLHGSVLPAEKQQTYLAVRDPDHVRHEQVRLSRSSPSQEQESVHTTPRNGNPYKEASNPWIRDPSPLLVSAAPDSKIDAQKRSTHEIDGLLAAAKLATESQLTAEAEMSYQKALVLDPDHVEALCGLAMLLHSTRSDLSRAESLYQHALRINPMHVASLSHYGLLLRDKYGDDAGGEVYFKRALEIDPSHTDTLCNYALLLTNVKKDHVTAADLFRKALDSNPWHVRSLCGYGMLLQNVNSDFAAARSMYSRALQQDPNHIPTTINLAVLYRDNLNEPRTAESLIIHALKLDPDNHWLKANAAAFRCEPDA